MKKYIQDGAELKMLADQILKGKGGTISLADLAKATDLSEPFSNTLNSIRTIG